MRLPKFKLEKLTIYAYKNKGRTEKNGTFEAMFNPETYSKNYVNEFVMLGSVNNADSPNYAYTHPQEITLNLVLGGPDQYDNLDIKSKKSVKAMVDNFTKLTLDVIGETHQPAFLKIVWGALVFECRLKSVDIAYTLFNRGGQPLRANLTTIFVADPKESKKSSPDLTHERLVVSGDNLPLMANAIYQNPALYMQVAKVNELDNFRHLKPGASIFFPPIQNE